jgi:hypothetical protein
VDTQDGQVKTRQQQHAHDDEDNHDQIGSGKPNLAPSSKYSNKARTGTRVPLNTHAPLTRFGELSAAGH